MCSMLLRIGEVDDDLEHGVGVLREIFECVWCIFQFIYIRYDLRDVDFT